MYNWINDNPNEETTNKYLVQTNITPIQVPRLTLDIRSNHSLCNTSNQSLIPKLTLDIQ